ncbi:hypothetical protein HNQ07_000305 [Deinococcus metalli]|uniref:Zinc metalloendopeptidase n=1 Tax=Deinococcus metalli TaxID=1141878 RepID=A0A7W8KB48_9DEIO|nr:leishmanolysin-related zinc metalloendopeptidase [Deinococcus metalli]MBB5374861.1 hypothetical protein [Deinococcus metalli]GHF33146.1 zinc metalloendopeptidase [Deinococcus metalli]
MTRSPLFRLACCTALIGAVLTACGRSDSTSAVSSGPALQAGAPDLSGLAVDPGARIAALQPQATETYAITLNFAPGSASSVVNAMTAAAKRWQGLVTQGLPNATVNIAANTCGSNAAYSGTIDDLLVFTGSKNIDGPGGILAQSGPCSVRTASGLTLYSTLIFDSSDLAQFGSQLTDIATHELGHSLGIGSLWSRFRLVSGANSNNPVYTGANGVREYRAAGGTLSSVPVENQGGSGTKGAHWRETTFNTELMTGYLNSGVKNPLSRISVGSLQDMGYAVNYAGADAYSVPLAAQGRSGIDLDGREQIIEPKYRVD